METYGLTKRKRQPDPAAADMALEADGVKLMHILQAVYDGTGKHLDRNASLLDNVVNRLYNSVNGHLKRNVQVLKPIGQILVDHVNHLLSQNDAVIGAAAQNPAIADYLRSVPDAVTYSPSTPTAPPDAGPVPPIAPFSASTVYTVLLNRQLGEAIAVPGTPDAWPRIGFSPAPGWEEIGHFSATVDTAERRLHELLQGLPRSA